MSRPPREPGFSNFTDPLSRQEAAGKSPNGSAEIRAQAGKSCGRGALEGCDTHLSSKWTTEAECKKKKKKGSCGAGPD